MVLARSKVKVASCLSQGITFGSVRRRPNAFNLLRQLELLEKMNRSTVGGFEAMINMSVLTHAAMFFEVFQLVLQSLKQGCNSKN